MKYVISDIHGCYDQFRALTERIGIRTSDTLYILGDCVDKGPEPVRVLRDLAARDNVAVLMGNHDAAALKVLRGLPEGVNEMNFRSLLPREDRLPYIFWMRDGGRITAEQFMALPGAERERLLDFMGSFLPWAETEAGGRHYVMVHAGIHGFAPDRPMSSYSMNDLILHRADYGRRYFTEPDRILVTGHTPTFTIRSDGQSLVYREQGHLAVDCGCVYGGCLCAVCLDNLQVWYQT